MQLPVAIVYGVFQYTSPLIHSFHSFLPGLSRLQQLSLSVGSHRQFLAMDATVPTQCQVYSRDINSFLTMGATEIKYLKYHILEFIFTLQIKQTNGKWMEDMVNNVSSLPSHHSVVVVAVCDGGCSVWFQHWVGSQWNQALWFAEKQRKLSANQA